MIPVRCVTRQAAQRYHRPAFASSYCCCHLLIMASDTPHKGIMLAERPAQVFQQKAFLPTCATEKLEPLGLSPAKKVQAHSEEKIPGISFYYRQWLQEMQDVQQQQRQVQQSGASEQQKKKEAVAAFGEKLRSAILNGGNVSEFWKAADADKGRTKIQHKKTETSGSALAEAEAAVDALPESSKQLLQGMNDFVDQMSMEPTTSTTKAAAPSSTHDARAGQQPAEATASTSAAAPKAQDVRPGTSGSSKGKKGSMKPAWALSEVEARAKQVDEEMELLDFADNLDFDTFVQRLDDVELQDTFQALQEAEASQQDKGGDAAWRKSFVRALNHVAFKQVQGQGRPQDQDQTDDRSEAGMSEGAASRATHTSRARSDATAARLAALAGKQEADDKWDSTSRVGPEDAKSQLAASKLQAAEDFLIENPELKGVHSKASVRAMIIKSEQQLGSPVATN